MTFRCRDCGAEIEQDRRYPAPRCFECVDPSVYLSHTYIITGRAHEAGKAMELKEAS